MRKLKLSCLGLVMLSSLIISVKTVAQVEWISTTNSKPWVKNQINLVRLSDSKIDATIIPEVKEHQQKK